MIFWRDGGSALEWHDQQALRSGTVRTTDPTVFMWQVRASGIPPGFQNYTAEEACEIASTGRFEEFYFIGDSLCRHVVQGTFIVLSGDHNSGGVKHW
jgi:hypothetical protein